VEGDPPSIFKLSIDIFDEIRATADEEMNAVEHTLSFYFLNKPEFKETIALLCDLLSINYRMIKEMDIMKEESEVEDGSLLLMIDEIFLLEAATLAKIYTANELKKTCSTSIFSH
jgi:hypothetical protein